MDKYNADDYIIITGTAESDSIDNYGQNVVISGDTGNDTISNGAFYDSDYGTQSTIYGGAGDDEIINWASLVAIYGDDADSSHG